jgi:hypothetical protein
LGSISNFEIVSDNLLSIQNLYTRNTGSSLSANRIKGLQVEDIDGMVSVIDLALAIKVNLSVMHSAQEQVQILELLTYFSRHFDCT